LLIGPFDLSVTLGHEGDYVHPEVQQAVRSMIARAQARQMPVIMPVLSPDLGKACAQLEQWQGLGLNLFVVGTDKILIADQMARYAGGVVRTRNTIVQRALKDRLSKHAVLSELSFGSRGNWQLR
jgi:4-hydroxy-2-oxoheptanedioate aldolase